MIVDPDDYHLADSANAGSAGSADLGAGGTTNGSGAPSSGAEPNIGYCGEWRADPNGPYTGEPFRVPCATPDLVWYRIADFLGTEAATPPALPEVTTPSWAGDTAMSLLDSLEESETPSPGLIRFFIHWSPGLQHTTLWADLLTRRAATLSDLLAFSSPSPDGPMMGILTDPGLLRKRTTISGRGAWMADNLFCNEIPLEAPDHPAPPAPEPGLTRRQSLEAATSSAGCATCHSVMNSLGFSLEHFDEMGVYRELDNGQPVDSSGSYPWGDFTSVFDLAPQLGRSVEVAACFARKLQGHAVWNGFVIDGQDGEIGRIASAFIGSEYSIRVLIRAIVESPSFLAE
jgi:hypothetical protein